MLQQQGRKDEVSPDLAAGLLSNTSPTTHTASCGGKIKNFLHLRSAMRKTKNGHENANENENENENEK